MHTKALALFVFALLFITVSGCATGYHPMQRGMFAFPETEGYAEDKLPDGSYNVVYSTGPGTKWEEALALWHQRAKELCGSSKYEADTRIDDRSQYVYNSATYRQVRLDNPGGFKSEAQRLVNELKLRACENWPRSERTPPEGSETRA